MMDISISINNRELHYIELFNRGQAPEADEGVCRYTWKLYSYPGGAAPNREGEVTHRRSDGALVLAARVMSVVAQFTEPRDG